MVIPQASRTGLGGRNLKVAISVCIGNCSDRVSPLESLTQKHGICILNVLAIWSKRRVMSISGLGIGLPFLEI